MFFWFSLDYFVLVLFAFVVLGLVSSMLCQEIKRLQNNLFCVEWDVKPYLNRSIYPGCVMACYGSVTHSIFLLRH